MENKVRTVALETEFEAEMKKADVPFSEYPRAQMKRESYLCLNGKWQFELKNNGKSVFSGEITVPFPPESRISGVEREVGKEDVMIYSRSFALPEGFNKGRVILHFGAVDQRCEIYVNGTRVGENVGGYLPFSFDITDAVTDGENTILVTATDALDMELPYGKQSNKRGGMWYTKTSGIWQTVWLESVPQVYIEKLHIENRGSSVKISIEPAMDGLVRVAELGEFQLEQGSVTITPENPHFWSPEDPYLYDFTVEAGEDVIESYFAVRSLEIKKIGKYPRLCLNGKPYFFHGLLDQGYWPDGIFTPAAPECYADDILAMKKLGFNTLRKHIKVEPEEFYYQCDKLGMIVWQAMVNNGDYNFLRDTALPTVGLQILPDQNLHSDTHSRKLFLEGMKATVDQLKNHPCICYWTIFNEGWGQFDSDVVYGQLKALDDTRFIDSTSGWVRRKKTDVDSRHVYFRKVKLKGDGVKPLVLSEFGGKTYQCEDHLFNPEKSYGYGSCESLEALNEAVVKLYMDEVLPCVENGLCAAIYTQVSDVEDEINGLVTYDRKVEKMQPERMLLVAEALQQAVREK